MGKSFPHTSIVLILLVTLTLNNYAFIYKSLFLFILFFRLTWFILLMTTFLPSFLIKPLNFQIGPLLMNPFKRIRLLDINQ